jgi:hypothetical protein
VSKIYLVINLVGTDDEPQVSTLTAKEIKSLDDVDQEEACIIDGVMLKNFGNKRLPRETENG